MFSVTLILHNIPQYVVYALHICMFISLSSYLFCIMLSLSLLLFIITKRERLFGTNKGQNGRTVRFYHIIFNLTLLFPWYGCVSVESSSSYHADRRNTHAPRLLYYIYLRNDPTTVV